MPTFSINMNKGVPKYYKDIKETGDQDILDRAKRAIAIVAASAGTLQLGKLVHNKEYQALGRPHPTPLQAGLAAGLLATGVAAGGGLAYAGIHADEPEERLKGLKVGIPAAVGLGAALFANGGTDKTTALYLAGLGAVGAGTTAAYYLSTKSDEANERPVQSVYDYIRTRARNIM